MWRSCAIRAVLVSLAGAIFLSPAHAHHVLGRPSYALGEDSNTPPALEIETIIGDYDINYMVFPAFPKPGAPGRINLYVKHAGTGKTFDGKVTFTVRNDHWFNWLGVDPEEEQLGVQRIDGFVYHQNFQFWRQGNFVISAAFIAGDETYIIDFPLRVGAPSPWGPISITVAILVVVLVGVTVMQRRRVLTGKIRDTHQHNE